ncbi:tRNA(Ser) Um(44) 2'-O-methyltransferase [Tulasnella sp. 425]|nr:tRNA(Ser) Um(44) 2'-O-methyltransferase [Tulasnella sp. 425]
MSQAHQVPFTPIPAEPGSRLLEGSLGGEEADWKAVLSCPVEFSSNHFRQALDNIVRHPEWNSSIILRADILDDRAASENDSSIISVLGYNVDRRIRRRILPRRPERDGPLDQDCVFFSPSADSSDSPDEDSSLVILAPIIPLSGELPFYHPKVKAVAFRYDAARNGSVTDDGKESRPTLSLHIIPLHPIDDSHTNPESRLYRVCVSLAQSVWRIGFGQMSGYQKKVQHDVLVDKNEYQDFYLVMRERFKSIVEGWALDTDPLKHVFEDIGIATFLLLLWKQTYPARDVPAVDETQSWDTWGRPPGGWMDLGCGNGLLVHILVSMGYTDGFGIDVRVRKTWDMFPLETQAHLQVHSYDPTLITADSPSPQLLKPGMFLIGNHTDEMTPWLPILAALCPDTSFLSIPCCPWDLDQKFVKPRGFHKRADKSPAEEELERKLEVRGKGGSTSLYGTYLQWHLREGFECGFEVETEVLRIPSSRNWAMVALVEQGGENWLQHQRRKKGVERPFLRKYKPSSNEGRSKRDLQKAKQPESIIRQKCDCQHGAEEAVGVKCWYSKMDPYFTVITSTSQQESAQFHDRFNFKDANIIVSVTGRLPIPDAGQDDRFKYHDPPSYVITLHDDLESIIRLLIVLYYSESAPQKTWDFWPPVLKLCDKYQINRISLTVLPRLQADWPTTLSAWDLNESHIERLTEFRTHQHMNTGIEPQTTLDKLLAEPCAVIRFGRTLNVQEVLPSAFYHLSRLSPLNDRRTEELNMTADLHQWNNGRTANRALLESSDYEALLVGQASIRE